MVSSLAALKICIIDADSAMRRMLREELEALGITQVRECTDPEMGLLLLQDFPADLCIVDCTGSRVDELEFVNRLRHSDKLCNPAIPIILMMEHAHTQRVINARNAGINEFLVKPLTLRALHSRLLSIAENPRLFVRSRDYVGPDRRRIDRPYVGQGKRREDEPEGQGAPQNDESDLPAMARVAARPGKA